MTAMRHELKFVITKEEGRQLVESLRAHCRPDLHAGSNGLYEVSSLYYDTPQLRFYRDRNESVGYRRKVRLRHYSTEQGGGAYFLETKEKHKSAVAKKRIQLQAPPSQDIPSMNLLLNSTPDSVARREVMYLHSIFDLQPAVVVRYVRETLVAKDHPELRITLDDRLTAGTRSLTNYIHLEEPFFLPASACVLEVKSDRSIPLWLQSAMRRIGMQRVRYSKYCEAIDILRQPKNSSSVMRTRVSG